MTTHANETAMLAKIAAGETIESGDEMTDEYRENLIHLMLMQADSELAGGYGYVPFITKAPTIEEKHTVAGMVEEEIGHGLIMYTLLRDLGIDVDERIRQHDREFAWRLANPEADIGTKRVGQDLRVNIFYYPLDTWADFVMFNFCMDRDAGHQLEDVRSSSYGPWRRAIERIFAEEEDHVAHGELWVRRLAQDAATKKEAQEAFDKWYVRTMNIFGRPSSPRNALYRKLGLKRRDNDEVRQAFAQEVKPIVEACGLTLPDWRPPWA
ncbi:MAG TPA: Phenylacetic acid catabolic protein [Candidatus Tectomicrobia bacterium]|nr:Phenylacetic acid catabolic protein [Candidatus Tectomicrobia bacterium]